MRKKGEREKEAKREEREVRIQIKRQQTKNVSPQGVQGLCTPPPPAPLPPIHKVQLMFVISFFSRGEIDEGFNET